MHESTLATKCGWTVASSDTLSPFTCNAPASMKNQDNQTKAFIFRPFLQKHVFAISTRVVACRSPVEVVSAIKKIFALLQEV